jgi:hypothetical protein
MAWFRSPYWLLTTFDLDQLFQARSQSREEAIERSIRALIVDPSDEYSGPIPALSVDEERSSIYLQFPNDCANRLSWSAELVELRILPIDINDWVLTIDPRRVTPGPETIDVFGPNWSDGDLPEAFE